jgi:hypothetical protein
LILFFFKFIIIDHDTYDDEFSCLGRFVQLHCLQYLILELVSGGTPKKVGSFFSATDTDIPSANLRQFENFFNQLAFFPHILDYRGIYIYIYIIIITSMSQLLVDQSIVVGWVFDFCTCCCINTKP